tara:strand:+ start:473 stop:757 length:285 start_codon:yes stop_codon:yes gene_type:complete
MKNGKSESTMNHQKIKKWVEDRQGKPALVKGTGDTGTGGGLLRINFPGGAEESLENITWDKFFKIFDENEVQFLYQDENKDGEQSRFFKFVNKD